MLVRKGKYIEQVTITALRENISLWEEDYGIMIQGQGILLRRLWNYDGRICVAFCAGFL